MESINDGRNNKCAGWYRLLLRTYDWEISYKLLQCFRKCCGRLKHHWLLDKNNVGFQNMKSRAAQAVLSQLLVLKCCSMLIALFTSIDTSQPVKWRAVLQSVKEVIVILFEILDIGSCSRIGSLGSSELNKKPSEKPFLLIVCTFSAGQRLTHLRILK